MQPPSQHSVLRLSHSVPRTMGFGSRRVGIAKPVSLAIGTLVLIVFGSALLLISGTPPASAHEPIHHARLLVAYGIPVIRL